MNIVVVTNRKTRNAFINFPISHYKSDPYWVPPLWNEEKKAYNGKTNVMLRNNEYILFLVYEKNQLLGRNLVYIDRDFNTYYSTSIGFFGAFECANNSKASHLLLSSSIEWLKKRGMKAIRGPIHPIAESWGFLLKGYDSLPVLMTSHNPPYYHTLMIDAGLKKVKDLLVYEADLLKGYEIPKRIERFSEQLAYRHNNFSVRMIDTKHLLKDAWYIWHITNTSVRDNWGYVPVKIDVMRDMVRRLKLILEKEAIWFVLDKGTPVGFALGFPDPNTIIKAIRGKLLPIGFLHLFFKKKKIRRYRLLALGVLPQYHGMGLDVLLYKHLYDALAHKKIVLEANYILEDNWKIRNALEKLGMKRTKEYRVYEKTIT